MKFLKKRTEIIFSAIFSTLAVIAFLILLLSSEESNKKKKYIAYIGRYTNFKDTVSISRQEKNKFDLLHEITLRSYLKNISDSLKYLDLKLLPLDCRGDGKVSDSLYREVILKNEDVLFVIDNTWGENISQCAMTINQNEIPVLSTNADKNNIDFGTSALFTGNDDNAPLDLSTFITKVRKTKTVNFITETDYPLHEQFLNAFKETGIEVAKVIEIRGKQEYTFEQEDSIFMTLKKLYEKPGIKLPLIINTHKKWGIKILNYAEKEIKDLTIAGGAYITTLENVREFGKTSRNELIMMSHPNDALQKKLHNDLEIFRKNHKEIFSTALAPFFLKRCLNILDITSSFIKEKGDTIALARKDASEYFKNLKNSSLTGEYDVYNFDSLGILVREILFTSYKKGKLYSIPVQLNHRREIIPNIFFGIDIVDIHDIDVSQNTFAADFFYWIKIDTGFSKMEENIIFQNIQQNESTKDLILQKTDEDILYKLYKVSGKFYNGYELKNYPLDDQELEIKVEILKPSDKLKISFDQSSLDGDQKLLERFRIPAWDKIRYYFTVDNRITSSMRGDPENEEGKATVFKNFAFRLDIERKFINPFLEIILPLSLIGFVAIALLFVKDISFENLGEVSVGTFLGIITFSIAMSYITPSADYLTKADLYFWLTFLIVLTCFMTIIIINAKYETEKAKNVNINWIKLSLGILYPVLAFGIFLL
jgi:hypothetical protein